MPNVRAIMFACYLLSAGAMITANTAIARECYDANKEFAEKDELHKTNNKFLLGNLYAGPACICCALIALFVAARLG